VRTLLAVSLLVALPASAEPLVEVRPAKLRPGDPVVVIVRGGEPSEGRLGERPLRFWKAGKETFRAYAGLPVEQPVEPVELRVRIGERELARALEVAEPEWRTRELSVAPKFTDPPPAEKARQQADREAFRQAFDRAVEPPRFASAFAWPRKDRVTAPFGDRRTFNGETKSQHYGLDIDGKVGDPVVAVQDGLVVLARDCFGSGRSIVLDHGGAVFTTYFHLSRMDVKVGDKVKKGRRLGAVGKTGRVTGPHLHFGVRIGGLYVDPEVLLGLPLD
jgi:murein DD-endopeptidase MepM/ murein hydrolase activator NlpD